MSTNSRDFAKFEFKRQEKRINDTFGHEEGDRSLTDTANILKKFFRESDVLGRLGGDEFAVLLTEPSEQDIEPIIYGHIQKNLESHNGKAGRPESATSVTSSPTDS